jgi:Dual OB-containing domain
LKEALVITDLTRMQEGRVCIAGYNRNFECIRPVLPPPGIHESALYSRGSTIIFPFAVVEFDFTSHTPKPPHTEDRFFDPRYFRLVDKLDEPQKQKILEQTVFESVKDIFTTPIHSDLGFYVIDGAGDRSMGTIQPRWIKQVIHELSPDGQWKYRLVFRDKTDSEYRLTITDLAWRYFCDWQRSKKIAVHEIAASLLKALRSGLTFIRIGLARGWEKFPDRCYLQITGVYTFPDYLKGKIFSDFSQR